MNVLSIKTGKKRRGKTMRNKRVRVLNRMAASAARKEGFPFKKPNYNGQAYNPYRNFIRRLKRYMK